MDIFQANKKILFSILILTAMMSLGGSVSSGDNDDGIMAYGAQVYSDTTCKEGQILILRDNAEKYACIFESSFPAWESREMIQRADPVPSSPLVSSYINPDEMQNIEITRQFYEGIFESKDVSISDDYLTLGYIQHNPTVPTGRDAFKATFAGFFEGFPDVDLDIKRIYADGDYVLTHSVLSMSEDTAQMAVIDIFRLDEDGKIAEHWDVTQEIPDTSANDNTMFYLD